MTFEILVAQFGYPALAIGMLFEGETMLILGAFMSHRGYLHLPLVIMIGCLVAFASDQFFFWMGRTKGNQFLENRPTWKPHVEKAKSLLGQNVNLLFLGVRFMYGLRTVMPFVLGMSKLDPKKFALLDFVGALIWALTFGLAGDLFGQFIGMILEDVKEHEIAIVLGIILIGTGALLYYRYTDKVQKDAK
jgi:membrane protein DedA with SNARE-associated domain